MVSVGKIFERGILYEFIAFVLVYLISKYWFGGSQVQTLRYTVTVFVILTMYYILFHYIDLRV